MVFVQNWQNVTKRNLVTERSILIGLVQKRCFLGPEIMGMQSDKDKHQNLC